jgi:protein Tex
VDVARKRIGLTMKSDSSGAREAVRERGAPSPKARPQAPTSAGSAGGGNAFADALKGRFNRT